MQYHDVQVKDENGAVIRTIPASAWENYARTGDDFDGSRYSENLVFDGKIDKLTGRLTLAQFLDARSRFAASAASKVIRPGGYKDGGRKWDYALGSWTDVIRNRPDVNSGFGGFLFRAAEAAAIVGGVVLVGGVGGVAAGLIESAPAAIAANGTPVLESLSSAEMAANLAATNASSIAPALTSTTIPSVIDGAIAIPGTAAADSASIVTNAISADVVVTPITQVAAPEIINTVGASAVVNAAVTTAKAVADAKSAITVADVLSATKAAVATVGAVKSVETLINKDDKMSETLNTSVPLATAQAQNVATSGNSAFTINTDTLIVIGIALAVLYAVGKVAK